MLFRSSYFEEDMTSVLFQFFDPKHHCFTFLNYLLVPTMEEFSKLLGVPILDQASFTGLEKVPKPEVIAAALHLKRSDMCLIGKQEVELKVFLLNF